MTVISHMQAPARPSRGKHDTVARAILTGTVARGIDWWKGLGTPIDWYPAEYQRIARALQAAPAGAGITDIDQDIAVDMVEIHATTDLPPLMSGAGTWLWQTWREAELALAWSRKDASRVAEIMALAGPAETLKSNRYTHRLISGTEIDHAFCASMGAVWTIEGILPHDAILTVIWGASATYKSFIFGVDLGLSIATGKDWHGKKTTRKKVIYCCGEGQSGALKRIMAWQKHHNTPANGLFHVLGMPPCIDNIDDTDEFIQAVKDICNGGVIIIDTLARTMQGDENSTHDMSAYVNACKKITEETGAQVVLIHHTGKDEARGMRGSYALRAAADVEIQVQKTAEKRVSVRCEKQKDHDNFPPMHFEMVPARTGYVTESGTQIMSLVAVIADPVEVDRPLTGANRIAWDALVRATEMHGVRPSDDVIAQMGDRDKGRVVVAEEKWREVAYALGISESGEGQKKAFSRARKALISRSKVATWGGYYWHI